MKNEPNRKLIVFSEFADTVNYLGEALANAGLPVMKYTSADATSANKDRIRANFDAGLKSILQRNDYHILVATDAISEDITCIVPERYSITIYLITRLVSFSVLAVLTVSIKGYLINFTYITIFRQT